MAPFTKKCAWRWLSRLLPLALLLPPLAAAAAPDIGSVKTVVVYAYGEPPGDPRTALYSNDAVYAREVVETVPKGALHIVFRDDTDFRIGSASIVTLDKFVYDTENNAGEMVLSLGRGAFRFISGKLSGRGVQLITPTAYIGVRGTDFTVFVAEDGATLVAVLQGNVDITPRGGGAPASAGPGQLASIAADGASVSVGTGTGPSDPGLQDADDGGGQDPDSGGGD